MMTLEEAITHCKEKACGNTQCALEHRQLVEWLQELQQYRKNAKNEQPEVELFERPETPIKDAVEVTSRIRYIDEDLIPIAEFIMGYASWNLHRKEWNQPVIEVPLFRVLDALIQRGKPYCCTNNARKEE